MRRSFRIAGLTLTLVTLLALAGCGSSPSSAPTPAPAGTTGAPASPAPAPAPQKSLTKIRALLPTNIDEAFAPYPVAKYLGYWADEGLDVELVQTGGSTETAIQVAAGNGDLGAPSPAQVILGDQSGMGMNLKYFYTLYYRNIWSLSVLPDSPIKSVADLKGKKIGVSSMGSSGILYAKAFAAKAGLDPEKDVTFIAIGIGAQGATAIKNGQVDAVSYWDAMLAKLDAAGVKLRQLPSDPGLDELPDASIVAREKLLKEKPEIAIGFARGIAKAYAFTQANPEAAIRITWKLYPDAKDKTADDATALKAALFVNKSRMAIWDSPKNGGKYGKLIDEDWNRVVDFLFQQKIISERVPVSKFTTNEFIDQINTFDKAAVVKQAKEFDLSKLK